MTAKPTPGSENILAMNEALMLGSVRQHELTAAAEAANARLQKEITERKLAETALRDSEKRYRTLFDLGPVAVYSCDASGVIQQFNPRAVELWGRQPPPRDTAQRFCGSFKLFRPDGSFMVREQCPMADVASGKSSGVRDREVIIERPDHSRITVVVNIAPLKNDQGKITGAINCFYDITERKQAEEAQRRVAVLAATNQKLELEIAQRRTAQAALQASEQHQKHLLADSRHMRDQLRLLSRQVLRAQEEERKRISRELHDVIAQTLTGINLRLAALKVDATMNSKERERNITRTQQLVEQSVNVVHRFARELRPAVLDDIGLIPALHTFLKGFKEQTGIRVSLSAFAAVEEENGDHRIVFYRVAQEALMNVARHAQATQVDVSIQKVDGSVCMKITDNGKGLPPESILRGKKNNRLGLLGMRERLEMLGGKFSIESSPGKGATITAQIPVPRARSKMDYVGSANGVGEEPIRNGASTPKPKAAK
jgi:signal transduction histidine kinase